MLQSSVSSLPGHLADMLLKLLQAAVTLLSQTAAY